MTRLLRYLVSRAELFFGRLRPALVYGLQYGKGSYIEYRVRLRIVDGGSCTFGKQVAIIRYSEVTAGGGAIFIGDNSYIGQGSIIVSKDEIRIGRDCLIAEYVTIRDQNHRYGADTAGEPVRKAGFSTSPINVGDNVWIGAKATILAGVKIGNNAVIAAGSVVTGDVPEGALIAGVPARVIRQVT